MAVAVTGLPFVAGYSSLAWVVPAIFLVYKVLTFGRREKHLPPGPPTVPVLGNAHLIPSEGFFAKVKEWSEQYGSVFSLKIGQSTMVVLNDRKAIYELLVSKGAYYNDRPPDEQFQLTTQNENIAAMHEGPKWKAERKIVAQHFSPNNLDTTLKTVQEAEVATLLHDLLERPEQFTTSVKRTTASIASIALFGHRAVDWASFWAYAVYISADAVRTIEIMISRAVAPGTYLPVEQFPILKLIPNSWTESRRRGKESYQTITKVWNEAHERVRKRRDGGDKRVSMLDSMLDGDLACDVPLTYTELNNFLGAVHMGASDTTAMTTLTNILFLAKNPQFQERARVELDRVCGAERVPKWSDFKDLPFINCIVKEGLRMRPVVPTGVPHAAKTDRWYEGMLIPAGSTILIPAYALNHNADSSPDPYTYNPERFLPVADKLAPELAASPRYDERDHYSYGAGRRICVGLHLAERSLWRMVAQIIWAFRIEPAVGPDGAPVKVNTEYDAYEEGFLHGPKEYEVRFVPRSERHAEILRREFREIEGFLKQWE
ncbi:Cytochrome P450 2D18 [Colletotrichum higginsianum IMI 349063]|uniref:Cytochrome P450 2D18 n=1 Tax=Colletotrichum higginsianum (strain IMI 349063) TaxID=759273 RepID=A0A1B7Y063_COLHI|nr:Cytochrome P450 2D18 [Colletotrichum higginsianum IMI 349063]OBR05399.1 Cytochrome P450 2D18 [Colletotrichum higginsianum IMI 349063]